MTQLLTFISEHFYMDSIEDRDYKNMMTIEGPTMLQGIMFLHNLCLQYTKD
jgi:hypothetical protein